MSFIVHGPAKLSGTMKCSGAKNSALKVLSAVVLSEHGALIENLPTQIDDIKVKCNMLRALGCKIKESTTGLEVGASNVNPQGLVGYKERSVRTSLLLLGSLLARFGEAAVPLPGGCDLGGRDFDLHFFALQALGADCRIEDGVIRAETTGLRGNVIHFPKITTGGTENAIIAASMAEGHTRIINAHTRPEVLDLIGFLCAMGAKIKVIGNGIIDIEGPFTPYPAHYRIIPDNMEALTYVVYASITGGELEIYDFPLESLTIPLAHLKEAGVQIFRGDHSIFIKANSPIGSFNIATGPYPGINSDMQPLISTLALRSLGESRITDLRFPKRFAYVEELKKLGADINRDDNTLVIQGPQQLSPGRVTATDLRAGAALVAAALSIEGETIIDGNEQIIRGYSDFIDKMQNVGVNIRSV